MEELGNITPNLQEKGEGEKVSNYGMRPRAFSSVRCVIFVEAGQILNSQAPLGAASSARDGFLPLSSP